METELDQLVEKVDQVFKFGLDDSTKADVLDHLRDVVESGKIDLEADPYNYLFTTAKNKIIDLKGKPNQVPLSQVPDLPYTMDSSPAEQFLPLYITYIETNRNNLYSDTHRRLIVDEFVKLLKAPGFAPEGLQSVTQRIRSELTPEFTEAQIRHVRDRMKYIYLKLKNDFLNDVDEYELIKKRYV